MVSVREQEVGFVRRPTEADRFPWARTVRSSPH
jgi:hypothetical protein